MIRNRLAENAQRILETKSFADGSGQLAARQVADENSRRYQQANRAFWGVSGRSQVASHASQRSQPPASQRSTLLASGHANAQQAVQRSSPSLQDAGFNYNKNAKAEKVTKNDAPLRVPQGARYNIITGSVQPWF